MHAGSCTETSALLTGSAKLSGCSSYCNNLVVTPSLKTLGYNDAIDIDPFSSEQLENFGYSDKILRN
jgi:hypothetical protein